MQDRLSRPGLWLLFVFTASLDNPRSPFRPANPLNQIRNATSIHIPLCGTATFRASTWPVPIVEKAKCTRQPITNHEREGLTPRCEARTVAPLIRCKCRWEPGSAPRIARSVVASFRAGGAALDAAERRKFSFRCSPPCFQRVHDHSMHRMHMI